jgi:hypothetical protein
MSGSLDQFRVELVDHRDVDAGVLLYEDGDCRILTNRSYRWVAAELRDLSDSLDVGLTTVEPTTVRGDVEEPGAQFASSDAAILTVVIYTNGARRVLTNRGQARSAVLLRRIASTL